MAVPDARPTLVAIAGPTASGKSARALALAEHCNGTIVNADASQVYRDLRILSARPSAEDEARIPHMLFGYRDGAEACSAAAWARDAAAAIASVHAAGRLPILVGGTGLYLRTLLDGIAPIPAIAEAIRADVRALTSVEAHAALTREDPAAAARLHRNDTARTQRALEVVRSTGRPIAAWREAGGGGLRGRVVLSVELVNPPLETLYANCDARFDTMLAQGAIDEVRALLARGLDPALPVMRAIGVPPLADHLAGRISLAVAADRARQATRNYAKRQRTWFRNQPLDRNPD